MKQKIQSLALASAIAFIFTACGGEDESNQRKRLSSNITGQFIDDPVQGLLYSCSSGVSGTTNSNGEYTCQTGDNVTFSIGSATIGTIAAQISAITPYSLFPNNKNAAINLARLLQSLDTKSNNYITINTVLADKLSANLDFTKASFETESETALGITLVNASDAQRKMDSSILNAGGSVPREINHLPIANAGADQSVEVNTTVFLDGNASSDSDFDILTYKWNIVSTPIDDNTSFIYFDNNLSTISNPSIILPVAGEYIFSLSVNDGSANSVIDTVTIQVGMLKHNGFAYGTVVSPFTGRTWLDRNLGASRVCTSYNDSACYGDYYQWGRNTDEHEHSTSDTTTVKVNDINNAGINFIVNSSSPRDWTTIDNDGSLRSANWNKTDGSSVCPIGYRVPSIYELRAETTDDSVAIIVSDKIDAFNNFLKLPSSGERKGSTGRKSSVGSAVHVWSATPYESKAYKLSFRSSSYSGSTYRSNGHPVRCIKD